MSPLPALEMGTIVSPTLPPPQKPLIVQRIALPTTQPQRNNFPPLCIPVQPYPALIHIVVVVALCRQLAPQRQKLTQPTPQLLQKRSLLPRHHSAPACFVVRLLPLFIETQVVPSMLVDHPPVHKSLSVPLKVHQLLEYIITVCVAALEQTVCALFDYQNPRLFGWLLRCLVQIHHLALIPPSLKLLPSLFQLLDRVSLISHLPDDLHSLVIFSLVPECYRYRTHISFANYYKSE